MGARQRLNPYFAHSNSRAVSAWAGSSMSLRRSAASDTPNKPGSICHAPPQHERPRFCSIKRGRLDEAFERIRQAIASDQLPAATAIVENLLTNAALGRHLLTLRRIVLAGRPNVGKSSLINALVGYERSVVHSQAGTTRDVVRVQTVIDGWPIELTDTAGLRQRKNRWKSRVPSDRCSSGNRPTYEFSWKRPLSSTHDQ